MTRFLLVKLGSLGDIVHALPVAAALRRARPDARIDWVVAAQHRPLLDLVPVLDRRVVVGGGASLLESIRELRRTRYDVALDLQGLIKSGFLARSSGAARVVGFSTRYLREPLARVFYTEVYEPRGAMHVVDLNLSILEPIGIRAQGREFPIEAAPSDVARRLGEEAGGRYALLNPGAAWPNKRWPPDRFGVVAAAIRERWGFRSVVTWGPGEEAMAREVVERSEGSALLAPRTSIADLIALVRDAAVMVSGDTGPTHLGAAVGTPIVGIYGPTRPARNGPWSASDVTVSRDEMCRCHHKRRCRQRRWCLLDIDVDEVVQAVARRLAQERPHA